MNPTRSFKCFFFHNLFINIAYQIYNLYHQNAILFLSTFIAGVCSPLIKKTMALSALITQIDSDLPSSNGPKNYTAQSPSLARYRMTSTIIDYGDASHLNANTGITGLGFVTVQYHNNNQWNTGTIWTSQTGAQLNTLIVA